MSAAYSTLPPSQPLASIGERFTVQFIDALAGMAVAVVTYMLVKMLRLAEEWLIVTWAAYLLFCDGLPGGRSLDKRVTHSAVVHVDTGEPCGYWRSVVRNLPLMVLGVFDAVFIVGSRRRRLGDYLAGTRVVRLP
ncbi:RDD family protein [Azohydromonas aeria]|uniref:RDD family protein n=1 Tax=Azohydromonas aeria TaxID=2590212 RepID=UPI0012F9C99B|nr:RDD family protein [Azohydromonas aeria]